MFAADTPSKRSPDAVHATSSSRLSLLGVNLSGGEYGNAVTGQPGRDYVYPTHAEIDHIASKKLNVIRLPFLWERVQAAPYGPLRLTELAPIDEIVAYASTKGIKIILDPHNYGYGFSNLIGSTKTPVTAFVDFWAKLAAHFAPHPNVIFGLMNEPHDQTPSQWLEAANAAIAAIRDAGATLQEVLVPGTAWDGAWTWASSGNLNVVAKNVRDPCRNVVFEVHQFLDGDGSGTHREVVSTTIGAERLTEITEWAQVARVRLFLGEFGVASSPEGLLALAQLLKYMQMHAQVWQGGSYWAAGPWMGSYMYSAELTNGVDAPQMHVLADYAPNKLLPDKQ